MSSIKVPDTITKLSPDDPYPVVEGVDVGGFSSLKTLVDSHETKIVKNIDEINKLKPIGKTFTYSGKTNPTYDSTPHGNYILVFRAMQSNINVNAPLSSNLVDGTILSVFNDDTDNSIRLRPGDQSYTFNGATMVNIPSETFNTYVYRQASKVFEELEGGYIPAAKFNLSSLIRQQVELDGFISGITVADGDESDSTHFTKAKSLVFDGATITQDKNNPNKLLIDIPTSGSSSGITVDDGISNIAGINTLNYSSVLVEQDPDDPKIAEVKPYVTIDSTYNNTPSDAKANQITLLPPLQAWSDPNKDLGAMIEIAKGTYEPLHAPSFLAYLDYDESIVGKEGEASKHHDGTLWFSDVVVPSGPYIETKKNVKTYGIQEADGLDPNITGGMNYLVAFRVSMKGKAKETGIVKAYIKGKTIGVSDSDGYLLDTNGLPMVAQKHYKIGDDLGYIDVMGIVNAKGLVEFTCHVTDDFPNEYVTLNDRVNGGTGLLIQALNEDFKTGLGLMQFEEDTKQDIRFSSVYMGENFADISWLVANDIPVTEGSAGQETYLPDGFYFYNHTPIKIGVQGSHIVVTDNGSDMAYYTLGRTFDSDVTKLLSDKEIKVSTMLTDQSNAFTIKLVKWTGTPDQYPKTIIKDIVNSNPVYETGWSEVDSLFISEDPTGQDHEAEKTFTIPVDAINFAVIIAPNDEQQPSTLKLNKLQIDVVNPFIGYILHAPELLSEEHLRFSKGYKELVQDHQSFYSLRYTINDSNAPMPVGIPGKGSADIGIDPSVNQVTGSSAKGGEGAIKFLKAGKATIESQLNVFNELDSDSSVSFWYSTVGPDGSLTKIPESEGSVSVPAKTKNLLFTMPKFSIDVEAGDRVALTAKANQKDGAFIEAGYNKPTPLIKTRIDFDELVPIDSSDTVDLISAPLNKFENNDRRVITFENHSSPNYEINIDIPDGIELANHSVVSKVGDKVISIQGSEFSYDNATKTLTVHKGNVTTGKIYLEFWGNLIASKILEI